MPRKGAATAAPKPDTYESGEPTVESQDAAHEAEQAEEDKPARSKRGGGRSKEAEEPEGGYEDWTKPEYADNPGEFEFDAMDDSDEWYRIMWFGGEGTGKTTDTMLVTRILSDQGRVLLINAEAGAKRTALTRHGVDTSRVALYPPKGQQLTFEGLERLFYRVQADLEQNPSSWGAVVWDSVTAIYQKLLDDVIEADMRKQAEILQRAKKTRAGRSGNITLRGRFETERDDYAEMSNQVRLLLRKYRSLHCHLLVTALERRDEDKKKNVTIGPAVSPALATDLLGYMDAVIRTQVNEHGVYFGRSQPTDDARGKDRLNALPVEMVDPTIERVHQYVTGKLDEETDRAQRRLPDREIIERRSLADEYLDMDEPPAEEPEPPKRPARRSRAASSGQSSAPAKPSATEEPASSEPESAAPEPKSAAAEPPKASGRKRSTRSSTSSAEASEEMVASGTEEKSQPARRSGRKPAADRAASAARTQVKAETEGTKSGPATKAAAERASKAAQASGFNDEPPF